MLEVLSLSMEEIAWDVDMLTILSAKLEKGEYVGKFYEQPHCDGVTSVHAESTSRFDPRCASSRAGIMSCVFSLLLLFYFYFF